MHQDHRLCVVLPTTTHQLWVICTEGGRTTDCLCYGVNRDANAPEGMTSTSLKPPIPPFEARGVDDIMRLRDRGDAGVKVSTSDKNGSVEVAPGMPIQDSLQGQRPKSLKAWMDFRVSFSRAWNQGGKEPRMCPLHPLSCVLSRGL